MAILTATQANFSAQLAKMNPGDRLEVSGPYSGRAGGRKFSSPTTIDFRQAQVSDVYCAGWGGVQFLGGQAKVGAQYMTCLRIEDSSDISFSGWDIAAGSSSVAKWGAAIWLARCTNALIENIKMAGAPNGILTNGVNGLTIRKSEIRNSLSDALNITDCPNFLLELCFLLGLAPSPGDHPDLVQIRRSAGKPVVKNVIVRNNTMEGPGQGVFAGPDDSGPAFDGFIVENNDIIAGMPNGIFLNQTVNGSVVRNRVRTYPGSQYQSRINFTGPTRSGNIQEAYTDPKGVLQAEVRDPDYVPPPSTGAVPPPSPTPTPTPPKDISVTLAKGQKLIVSGAASATIIGQ